VTHRQLPHSHLAIFPFPLERIGVELGRTGRRGDRRHTRWRGDGAFWHSFLHFLTNTVHLQLMCAQEIFAAELLFADMTIRLRVYPHLHQTYSRPEYWSNTPIRSQFSSFVAKLLVKRWHQWENTALTTQRNVIALNRKSHRRKYWPRLFDHGNLCSNINVTKLSTT